MNLDIAVNLCKRFEGFRSAPYICPAGVATIGYGSTYYADGKRVALSDPPMSREAAEALLRHELEKTFAPGVRRLCPGLEAFPEAFNAITDFSFNLGVGRLQTSTLRRRINARDWAGAREQLALWNRGGGKVLPGLVLRRTAEAALLPTAS